MLAPEILSYSHLNFPSLTQSKSFHSSTLNQPLPTFFNQIQIAHSTVTQNANEIEREQSKIDEEGREDRKCRRCRLWEEWAKESQTSLLKIQKDLIDKEERLAKKMQEMREKARKEKENYLMKENLFNSTIILKEEQLANLTKENQRLQKQTQNLLTLILTQEEKEKQILKENISLKKKMSKKTDQPPPSNHLNPWQNGYKVKGTSKFQPSVTDCSGLRECKDQGQASEDFASMNSQWKDNLELSDCQNSKVRNVKKEKRMQGLSFENENLKSYNRVLLEKLNVHRRFGKY